MPDQSTELNFPITKIQIYKNNIKFHARFTKVNFAISAIDDLYGNVMGRK